MKASLHSWGRHPRHPQTPHQVHWRSELPGKLAQLRSTAGSTLAYGNGRSYGDSCLALSDHVIAMRPLDRVIAADWEHGWLAVEAGMTLGEVLDLSVPRGWFLPVTPGTRFVTVGGAIANDVHGKNHHRRGSFGCHVHRIGLLRSREGRLSCTRDEHPELYAATIGGLGLTGVMEWAEIRLAPIRSSMIDCFVQRFDSLAEFFSLSAELDPLHEFSVAWIDGLAAGSAAGRGVYFAGDFASDGALSTRSRASPGIPFVPPVSLVNRLSVRLFNSVYWRRHPARRSRQRVHYEPFFYPLDGILNWNRIYGRRGMQQYQCVIPPAAAEPAMHEFLWIVASAREASFLAVLKQLGPATSPGLLSFPRPGVTLALDFPNSAGLQDGLFRTLDAIVRDAGGRLYPAKDAHMSPEDFRRGYPAWQQLEVLRDPALNSRFWQRVTG